MTDSLSTELKEKFIVPLLLDYVYWVLQEAEKRGLRTLYFLSRDGYILQKMAIQVCRKEHISIHCKYLYCSRAALRMPTYALIGEEAFELLLLGGYQVSKKSLLARAELNREQRYAVWADCGEPVEDEEKLLSRYELKQLREKLKASHVFRELVLEKSKVAYPQALGYFRQEGLLESDTVAIVDSGWTGSMQRSLRQLLGSAGFEGKIVGFYFGMYAEPKEKADGTYLTYYFDKKGKIRDKILFSNNLFECLLQAPHGMTLGYEQKNGCYFPQLDLSTEKEEICAYIQEIMDIAGKQLRERELDAFKPQEARRETRRLTNRYMVHPAPKEVELLGKCLFCDDVNESYQFRLASQEQTCRLKQYSIIRRVFRRLFLRRLHTISPELYWPYGTIAFLPGWQRLWYQWNVYLWELIRYLRQ